MRHAQSYLNSCIKLFKNQLKYLNKRVDGFLKDLDKHSNIFTLDSVFHYKNPDFENGLVLFPLEKLGSLPLENSDSQREIYPDWKKIYKRTRKYTLDVEILVRNYPLSPSFG